MATCGFCGVEQPTKDLFGHQWKAHREQMLEKRSGSRHKGKKEGTREVAASGGEKRSHTLSPVHAALVEFVAQSIVVPNTPALTYGYLCARKFGFQGDIALFIQEMVDDFYTRRGMNYYQEVMGWTEIGSVLKEPGLAPSGNGQGRKAPTPSAPK